MTRLSDLKVLFLFAGLVALFLFGYRNYSSSEKYPIFMAGEEHPLFTADKVVEKRKRCQRCTWLDE